MKQLAKGASYKRKIGTARPHDSDDWSKTHSFEMTAQITGKTGKNPQTALIFVIVC